MIGQRRDELTTGGQLIRQRIQDESAERAEKDAEDANTHLTGFMRRLHTELVRATGKLADPADLEFDPSHLYDETALSDAIDALLLEKPHLRSRIPTGDVGQGDRGGAGDFSLLSVLKSRA